jgi:DNA-3-methyladenine glycosylase II
MTDYATAIATLKQADPMMASLIDQVGECTLHHQQQTGDVLSALTRAIVYQQLSGKAAAAIHRRFLELYPNQPGPTALDILNTPDETLRSVGFSRSKVIYVKDLAQHVQAGLPAMKDLEQLDDEAIIQALIPIKGIGRWSVQMLLIFRLHRWDILPVDDLGVRAGAKRVYQLAELPNKKELELLAHVWKPYRTIASWYLWRSIDQVT